MVFVFGNRQIFGNHCLRNYFLKIQCTMHVQSKIEIISTFLQFGFHTLVDVFL